ncbi:hypothetical protein GCM10010467_23360 [Actinocorallia glomerata]|uniref:Uncharacterized protein n=2 Tax=Actinomycetes TaxID=1760 RepID=A0ABP6LS16_9MICC
MTMCLTVALTARWAGETDFIGARSSEAMELAPARAAVASDLATSARLIVDAPVVV